MAWLAFWAPFSKKLRTVGYAFDLAEAREAIQLHDAMERCGLSIDPAATRELDRIRRAAMQVSSHHPSTLVALIGGAA